MKVLITGSSGLIGSATVDFFNKPENQVYKLVRGKANSSNNEIGWDPEKGIIHRSELEGFDVVIHLGGENIMGRWTDSKKKRIEESRVKGTDLICKSLCDLKKPPSVFISASAIGYYGNRGEEILDEHSPKGKGFLADVCQKWEESTRVIVEKGVRVVNLRIGMVLSATGGALKEMLPIFKLGLGGKMGGGDQIISWIVINDLVRVIDFAIHQENLAGPLNAVTPYPVTNKEMTKILGHLLHRPTFFTLPKFMINLIFGELGKEVFLSSARVRPKKLEALEFQYQYPCLETALGALLHI